MSRAIRGADPSQMRWSNQPKNQLQWFTIIDDETGLMSKIIYDHTSHVWLDPQYLSVGHSGGSPQSSAPIWLSSHNGNAHIDPVKTQLGAGHTVKPKRKQVTKVKKAGGSTYVIRNLPHLKDINPPQIRKHPPPRRSSVPGGIQKPRPNQKSPPVRDKKGKVAPSNLDKVGKVNQRELRPPAVELAFLKRCEKKGYNPSFTRWFCKGAVREYKPPFSFSLYLNVQKKYAEEQLSILISQGLGALPPSDENKLLVEKKLKEDPSNKWLFLPSYKHRVSQLKDEIRKEIGLFHPDILSAFKHISLNDLIECQNNVMAFYDHCFFLRENLIGHTKVVSVAQQYLFASLRNRDRAIQWFKDYIEVIKRTICSKEDSFDSQLLHLRETREPENYERNIFLPLLRLELFKNIARTKVRNHSMERALGALTARSMAKPTKSAEEEAFKKFTSVVLRESPCKIPYQTALDAAIQFGKECKTYLPKGMDPGLIDDVKINLGTSACLEYTHSDGGRTAFFREKFLPWLKAIPDKDEEIILTLGDQKVPLVKMPQGRPRFQTCVPPGTDPLPYTEFDAVVPDLEMVHDTLESFGWTETCQAGFSKHIGFQLYIFSQTIRPEDYMYKSDDAYYPLIHASPVIENGGKTRWITIMSMIDSIKQDVAQNLIQGVLIKHPLVRPIFTKSNQAWQLMNVAPPRCLDYHDRAYVSDYSNATDAIDIGLAKAILLGFCKGAGLESPHIIPGIESLCSRKAILHRRDRDKPGMCPVLTNSGIFMGEPLTKVTLTILMYILPLLSLSKMKVGDYGRFKTVAYPPWYFYFAPGDDHIASGPDEFLDTLGETSCELGMLLNRDKTYKSTTFVPFCEQWIYVPNLRNGISTHAIFESVDGYVRSAWVETLKLKLLSPAAVTEKFKNVEDYSVLGRSRSFMTCLEGLTATWSLEEREAMRDYFVLRYVDQLPPKSWWQYHYAFLHTHIGGLGLSINKTEELRHWNLVPQVIRRALSSILKSESSELYSVLSTLCMPKAVLGYEIQDLEDACTLLVQMITSGKKVIYHKAEGFKSYLSLKERLKGLLFDYAISSEKLAQRRYGSSMRYETRLRNAFSIVLGETQTPKLEEDDGCYFLVREECKDRPLSQFFVPGPGERVVLTLQEFQSDPTEYEAATHPLPQYEIILEAEEVLPRFEISDTIFESLSDHMVSLGIPKSILAAYPF